MKKETEKKPAKAEKKVAAKSVARRETVQKKPAAKAVKKAEPKKVEKTDDEVAFDKFLATYDSTLAKRCGRNKLYGIYQAGIKRGKKSK